MEKDSFIGSKFKDLEVLGWDGTRQNGAKAYTVICRKCELDPELHGTATYKVTKHYLKQNKFPCGCGKAPNWSDEQYDIRLKRVVDSSIEYTRLSKGSVLAKFDCECKICGNKWTSTLKNLLDGYKCRKCCHADKVISQDDRTQQFMSTGAFLEGTKFWTNYELNTQNRYIWYYTCPKCSNDGYVQAGVCSGVFETNSNALLKGGVACRCSRSYRKSKKQQLYDILNKCKENNHTFVCFKNNSFGYHDKVILECPYHEIVEVDIGGYLTQDRECPHCRTHGFKKHLPATFYILEINKEGKFFTGFGITNEPDVRLAAHKRELGKQGYSISKSKVWEFDGVTARDIEVKIKGYVSLINLNIDGFKRECCTNNFYEVCSIVEVDIIE